MYVWPGSLPKVKVAVSALMIALDTTSPRRLTASLESELKLKILTIRPLHQVYP